MPYSPDMAPMDYAVNGNLKTNLKRRVARNRGQLGRAIRYEWSKIKLLTIRRALRSWRKRVDMMVERFGDHAEHILSESVISVLFNKIMNTRCQLRVPVVYDQSKANKICSLCAKLLQNYFHSPFPPNCGSTVLPCSL